MRLRWTFLTLIALTACSDDPTTTATVPDAPSVTITPNSPGTNDDLTLSFAAGSDADGTLLTFTYDWSRDGVSHHDRPTLSADMTERGQSWTATVIAHNGRASSAPGAATVTIGNSAPSAPTVSIAEIGPLAGDALTAQIDVESVDPDGDSVTYTYVWSNENQPVAGHEAATLPAGVTGAGNWTVSVIPTDGTDAGGAGNATVRVTNNTPSRPSIAFTPPDPTTTDPLEVSITSESTDPDGHEVTYRYDWTVDERPFRAADGARVEATETTAGEEWTVRVTPHDGHGEGAVAERSVTISSTPPGTPEITLTPASPIAGDDLTVAIATEAPDIDGDAITYRYEWSKGDTVDDTQTESTLPSSETAEGDEWTVRVFADDGDDEGAPASATVTIGNTPPGAPVISLTPEAPVTGDGLEVTIVTDSVDVDSGDGVTYAYEWLLRDVVNVAYTTHELPSEATTKADVWTVRVIPSDEGGPGTAATATVTIGNTAPGDPEVSVDITAMACDSAEFDGDGTWASLGSPDLGGGEGFTMGIWYKPASDGDGGVLFRKGGETTELLLRYVPGTGPVMDFGEATVELEAPWIADEDGWTFALIMSDEDFFWHSYHTTGSPTRSADFGTVELTASAITLGGLPDGSELFEGAIGDVMWFSGELEPEEVWNLAYAVVRPDEVDGLVAWWPLGEGSGAALAEATGTFADGVFTDPAWLAECAVPTQEIVCGVDVVAPDVDEDTVEYVMTWQRNCAGFDGAETGVYSGDTVRVSGVRTAETFVCTATASDGEMGGSATASATLASRAGGPAWDGLEDGEFVTDENWTGGARPGVFDLAVINNGATVSTAEGADVHTLRIADGPGSCGTLSLNGDPVRMHAAGHTPFGYHALGVGLNGGDGVLELADLSVTLSHSLEVGSGGRPTSAEQTTGVVRSIDSDLAIEGALEVGEAYNWTESGTFDGTFEATDGSLTIEDGLRVGHASLRGEAAVTVDATVRLTDLTSVEVNDDLGLMDVSLDDETQASIDAEVNIIGIPSFSAVSIYIADGGAQDEASLSGEADLLVRESSLVIDEDVEIGGGYVTDTGMLDQVGRVRIEQSTLEVGGALAVGGLGGNRSDAANRSEGSLVVVESVLWVGQLRSGSWGTIESVPLEGTITGRVELDRSFVLVDPATNPHESPEGRLDLKNSMTLVFHVDGETRAADDNLESAGLYSAIDLDNPESNSQLAGTLDIVFDYADVEAGDVFDVIRALDDSGFDGDFVSFTSSGLPAGLVASHAITTNGDGKAVVRVSVAAE